ncbi:beta-ketoacyl synthase domain-containing protein [Pseudomassariella vexata]|uniref:Beta-ketoacyl synthase domain-containing protein n=1 Tax=Pseudomassariella vexata TaxID=1141098 RepID=A0A1Y2DGV5_9PEZI|nr:beta-ketoacyl synthase domain-containing protein [Pseudomassariella vexata]ORY58489.1 beta-ketoacyl synthase domain-containing protein [Pseudomassariella vexata]
MYAQPTLEPIAIVGSGCRFAGGATSPSKLWDVLVNPADLSREVPSNRFNAKAFYHPDGEYHGTTNSIKAYWLKQDHRVFDATFFNITPKEAEAIDPQQRLLLEVVYEAMESAGYTLPQCSGQDVAVFAGVMTADYDTLSQRDELSASQYYATGNARSIIANRISYFFNFRGPSMTIDTACSSSLVTLHQAVLSLRSGESTMACVTGVNLMITPEQFIVESNLHMLSPTGKSRFCDVDADGYARGEGVAALFLKPLSKALADGDEIEGIVRETGINSDGRTKGITMPNPKAQAALIRKTYRKTGLDPRSYDDRCQYFEAHGTGTQAGDPTEAAAIHEAFFGSIDNGSPQKTAVEDTGNGNDAARKMLVGSVKTVIGHTEGAAGLAGVLKVLQAMKHRYVPPNLHLNQLNPGVKPFYTHFEIPTVLTSWPDTPVDQPRRASVNSFGFGGTNAHCIIESYIPRIHDNVGRHFSDNSTTSVSRCHLHETQIAAGTPQFCLPLCFSATSERSLRAVVASFRDYLHTHPHVSIGELSWNLFSRRTALPHRAALSANSRSHGLKLLESLLEKSAYPNDVGVRSKSVDEKQRILGVFTGQGAQWATMSRSLLLSNKVYRQTIRNLDQVLQTCPDPSSWGLEEQILAGHDVSRVHEAAISQPLCTALQIGIVDVLRSLGIEFHTVIGHSSGEIAAAYTAGRLTARDAILISYYRGLGAHLAGGSEGQQGGMLAAGLSESEALRFCRDPTFDGRICIAASNAPSSVTLSGDLEMIHLARDQLAEQNKFARLLLVDTAYHSPHMTRAATEYVRALRRCNISPLAEGNGTKWVSSVRRFSRMGVEDLAAGYWKDNMVYTVQFCDAIEEAVSEYGPFDCAVEIGPHPALKGPFAQTIKSSLGTTVPYSGTLDRSKDDTLAFSDLLGFLWSHLGPSAVKLCHYIEQSHDPALLDCRLKDMPTYPWDHSQIHYRESRISRQYHFKTEAPHELLGVRTRDDNDYELRWRNILRTDKIPWLEHHSFQGQALVPASAYCIMAMDAARAILQRRPASLIEIRNLHIINGISVESDSPGVEVLFSLSVVSNPKERKSPDVIEARFTLTSCPADGTTTMKKNMEGSLFIRLGSPSGDALPPRQPCCSETLPASPEAFYRMMDATGLVYSGPFRSLQSIERRFNYSSARLRWWHPEDTTTLSISPATLDSCLQSAFLSYSSPGDRSLWTSFLPTHIECIRFNLATCDGRSSMSNDETLTVDTHLTNVQATTPDSKAIIVTDVAICNELGETTIQVEGLAVSSFANTRPEDDYELYLHTVMDVDPTDEIVQGSIDTISDVDPCLVESCERVAAFFSRNNTKLSPLGRLARSWSQRMKPKTTPESWLTDTRDTIDHFIASSPHHTSLVLITTLGSVLPDILPSVVPLVVEDAHHQFQSNQHTARIVRQIAHRYPRMNILSLVEPELGLTRHILSNLNGSFLSYTVGSEAEHHYDQTLSEMHSIREKVYMTPFNMKGETGDDSTTEILHDLVILSTSLLETGNAAEALKHVRAAMSDGGFLILIHDSRTPLKDRLRRLTGIQFNGFELATPPEWPDVLDMCGFRRVARNSDQFYASGVSISVRQASVPRMQLLIQSNETTQSLITDRLLIIGGLGENTRRLCQGLQQHLSRQCGSISIKECFESVDSRTLATCTAAIVLADLDEPVMSTMTEQRLEMFKSLFRPMMTILWLTHDARSGRPDHAATFGFTRTITAEVPDLTLQVLNLEQLENTESTIAQTFLRLTEPQPNSRRALWTREPEVHIEKGRRMIPRLLPLRTSNERINSVRRVVLNPVNTLESTVEVVSHKNVDGAFRYEAKKSGVIPQRDPHPGHVLLQVSYSSVNEIRLSPGFSAYVCSGCNVLTGEATIALSPSNASYIEVPESQAYGMGDASVSMVHLVNILARYLAAYAVRNQACGQLVALIAPDSLFAECVEEVVSEDGGGVTIYTTGSSKTASHRRFQIHPYASSRQLQVMLPTGSAVVYSFLHEGTDLAEKITSILAQTCEYHTRASLVGSECPNFGGDGFSGIEPVWRAALSKAVENLSIKSQDTDNSRLMPLPQLLSGTGVASPFSIIDWRAKRNAFQLVKPLIEENLLQGNKTYAIVGLTRDFGHSLCRLFIQHGARNIVLASRNPNLAPKWKDELASSHGANIKIEKMDVNDMDDVLAFKARISASMPPVVGVVNGAMVLEDRVFAQMTIDNWNRVTRPKMVGSKNLDMAFTDTSLDFFIMTSSFAAIGGHPGQSNYAAANMYMNGLALNRRKCGLAGSVLNIGVIYGLGLLQREKEELYAGLEQEGYPPISERDLHHMFLEAIVAGRPGVPNQPADITTGLSRFKWGSENPLHWHLDPRFSHYTVAIDSHDSVQDIKAQRNLKDDLSGLHDAEPMAETIMGPFLERLEVLLQLPKDAINRHQSMSELGVDSLVAVDVRNWIWKMVGRDMAVLKILGASSIHRR